MPIYMDIHIVPGIKARDVAEAHRKDILLQEEHECKCMTYWIDEAREMKPARMCFVLSRLPQKKQWQKCTTGLMD
jgi:hypothetical protein